MLKTILWWLSGFTGGCFLGALIACSARVLSLPVTGLIALVLGLVAWSIKDKKDLKKEEKGEKK